MTFNTLLRSAAVAAVAVGFAGAASAQAVITEGPSVLERIIGDIILGKHYPFDPQELLGAPAVNTILPGIDFYFDFHCNRFGIDFHQRKRYPRPSRMQATERKNL